MRQRSGKCSSDRQPLKGATFHLSKWILAKFPMPPKKLPLRRFAQISGIAFHPIR